MLMKKKLKTSFLIIILHNLFSSLYSSFQKAFGSDKHLYDDKNKLNKSFLKEVFSLYYNQPDLKVIRSTVVGNIFKHCVDNNDGLIISCRDWPVFLKDFPEFSSWSG